MGPFRAITFDCYGTLIDWETGILRVLRPWVERAGVAADDEALLGAFARAEPEAEESSPGALYPDILREVHRRIAERFGVRADDADADRLARSVGDWPAFPDTADALRRLGEGRLLMVVSNVDRGSFSRTRERLGARIDLVVTAEDVGSYKPAPAHFEAALRLLSERGIGRHEVLHAAQSLHHDIAPAGRLGLATVWVDRRAGRAGGATPPPPEGAAPDRTVRSLAALADLLGA